MSRSNSTSRIESNLMNMLDQAVKQFKEHPIKSAVIAFIVVWIIKKLIEAVRG